MYGAIIAFQDYTPGQGITGSPWVGLKHFVDFFTSEDFKRLMQNTLRISAASLVFGFPAPIILALLINEVKNKSFKKVTQTITYLPHFISLVVVCVMIKTFVSSEGIISQFIALIGHTEPKNYLQDSNAFLPIYLLSNIWAGMGWESIIYISALTTVEAKLYESARIDGAGKWKQLLNVKSDVISSYFYRLGFTGQQWSYTTAIGLFNSAVNLVFLIAANTLSKKLNETSLW